MGLFKSTWQYASWKAKNVAYRIKKSYAPDDDYWYMPFRPSDSTTAGIAVDEASALKYLVVYSCVTLISGDVARLPLNLYQRGADGSKKQITTHPLYDICHNAPNDDMDARTWIETGVGHDLLWGNSYSVIIRDQNRRIKEIWPVDNPGAVEVYRSPGGELRYKWRVQGGKEVDYPSTDILHCHAFGFNGLTGINPVTVASEAVGLGIALNQFAARYFDKGTHPSGMIALPPEAQKQGLKALREYKAYIQDEFAGMQQSHTPMVLGNGETYQPLTIDADKSQLNESRVEQKKEICGFYRVPAHKVQIHGANSNYNNMEQENQSYVDSCLIHWISRREKALTRQLLSKPERLKGLFFEFNMQGLLRGDSASRAKYYNEMWQTGSITPNEIRKLENQNPLPKKQNGDETWVPLNFIPASKAGELTNENSVSDGGDPGNNEPDSVDRSVMVAELADKRTVAEAEKRSILVRDRIAKNYKPLIFNAADLVVRKESQAIEKQVKKLQRHRSEAEIKRFIEDFYKEFPEYINMKLGPTLTSYARAIYEAAADEINIDPKDPEIDVFIAEIVESYAKRHAKASKNQLLKLADEEDLDAIATRAGEWKEKRADKIVTNETVRTGSAVYSAVAFSAGMGVVWRTRGKSCPLCDQLNGKKIRSGQAFLQPGDKIDPKDGKTAPLKARGLVRHPPLHRGCDCSAVIG